MRSFYRRYFRCEELVPRLYGEPLIGEELFLNPINNLGVVELLEEMTKFNRDGRARNGNKKTGLPRMFGVKFWTLMEPFFAANVNLNVVRVVLGNVFEKMMANEVSSITYHTLIDRHCKNINGKVNQLRKVFFEDHGLAILPPLKGKSTSCVSLEFKDLDLTTGSFDEVKHLTFVKSLHPEEFCLTKYLRDCNLKLSLIQRERQQRNDLYVYEYRILDANDLRWNSMEEDEEKDLKEASVSESFMTFEQPHTVIGPLDIAPPPNFSGPFSVSNAFEVSNAPPTDFMPFPPIGRIWDQEKEDRSEEEKEEEDDDDEDEDEDDDQDDDEQQLGDGRRHVTLEDLDKDIHAFHNCVNGVPLSGMENYEDWMNFQYGKLYYIFGVDKVVCFMLKANWNGSIESTSKKFKKWLEKHFPEKKDWIEQQNKNCGRISSSGSARTTGSWLFWPNEFDAAGRWFGRWKMSHLLEKRFYPKKYEMMRKEYERLQQQQKEQQQQEEEKEGKDGTFAFHLTEQPIIEPPWDFGCPLTLNAEQTNKEMSPTSFGDFPFDSPEKLIIEPPCDNECKRSSCEGEKNNEKPPSPSATPQQFKFDLKESNLKMPKQSSRLNTLDSLRVPFDFLYSSIVTDESQRVGIPLFSPKRVNQKKTRVLSHAGNRRRRESDRDTNPKSPKQKRDY